MRVNGDEVALERIKVNDLLARFNIDPRGIAVAVNGEVIRRADWANTFVETDDHVEIVTAAAGG